MRVLIETGRQLLLLCLLTAISGAVVVYAEVDAKFKLDDKTLKDISPPPTSSPQKQRHPNKPAVRIVATDNETTLTVKPDDTIEKLLMRGCGLTREETGPLVEEVRRRNKMLNIRRLFVGQNIVVPPLRCTSPGRSAPSPGLPPGTGHPEPSRPAVATAVGLETPKATTPPPTKRLPPGHRYRSTSPSPDRLPEEKRVPRPLQSRSVRPGTLWPCSPLSGKRSFRLGRGW